MCILVIAMIKVLINVVKVLKFGNHIIMLIIVIIILMNTITISVHQVEWYL